MNRMAPLITRAAILTPLAPWNAPLPNSGASGEQAEWPADLQFFLTAWLGAFLFLGTLLS